MIRVQEVWDVRKVFRRRWLDSHPAHAWCRIREVLSKLQGGTLDSHDMADYRRGFVCKISLPVGTKEEFEEMTGYRLTLSEVEV